VRRFDDQERAAQERDKPVITAAPVSTAARMLALQRTAGNRAVAAMLAREAAPKQEPAPAVAFIGGLGSVPLVSLALGTQHKGGDREHPSTSRDIPVMAKQGEFSSALALASQRGDVFEVELFVGDKVRIKLHKAMIASFSTADGHGGDGPMDSWTFNAESMEFVTDER
jgi:hypothetical protein